VIGKGKYEKWLVLFAISQYLILPAGSLHPGLSLIPVISTFVSGCFIRAGAMKWHGKPNAEPEITAKMIMIFKLCLLPVYVAGFLLLVASGIMIFTVWFAVPALFTIPIVIFYNYFVLFVSYGFLAFIPARLGYPALL